MGSTLDYFAALDNQNLVGVLDCTQAMRDYEGGSIAHEFGKSFLN
jgi:hypothetical protein